MGKKSRSGLRGKLHGSYFRELRNNFWLKILKFFDADPDPPGSGIFLTMDPVPEIIDPVFVKTSPKRSFCMTENKRFGLVFVKTGSINSGTGWKNSDLG
jgi:hypothetical protein